MKPGDLVSHFRIVQKIGEGGMGEVFIAQDETLKRRVALKTIRTTKKQRTDAHTRFAREARVLSQLDHPHICRIFEYISSDDGDMIVLELIEGRPVTPLGAEVKYAEKLVIAEQIASALVAAHAEGIVHRDLKPGNIMLTRAGGVKVLDFGLACVANSEDDVTTALTPSPEVSYTLDWSTSDESISGFHTEAGRVFGTVQYMAPEQADGENVGPAADMFSFGLVLQELFTGEPARRLVKQDGLARAAEGFSMPVKGVPSDLADLITRLKERAPTRRPTALDALKDLQRIRSKPQRRLRAALSVAAVLLAVGGVTKYTLDLKAQQAMTEIRRQQVEARNAYLIHDLYEILERVQLTQGFEDTVKWNLDYYGGIPVDSLLPDELVNYAKSWILAGRVRRENKDLKEAFAADQAALKLLDSQPAARVPEATRARLRRYALFQIGEVHQDRGEPDLAEAALREVADLASKPGDDWDDSLSRDAWKGRVHNELGDILFVKGLYPEANEEYLRARACLASIDEPEPEERHLQGRAEFSIGNLNMELRDFEAAEPALRRHLEISQALAAEAPSNKRWQKELAWGHANLGALHKERDETDAARKEVTKSIEIWRALTIHDPSNFRWKNSLADALPYIVASELSDWRADKALAVVEEEYEIREALCAHDSTNVSWLRARAICENNKANAFEALGRNAEAGEWFSKAVAHSRQVLAADPANADHQLDQATMLRRLGFSLTKSEKYNAAQDALEESVNILRAEPPRAQPRTNWLRALARTRIDKAELLLARNQLEDAEAELALVRTLLTCPALEGANDIASKDIRAFARWAQSLLFKRQHNDVEAQTEGEAVLELLGPVVDGPFSWRRTHTYLAATGVVHGAAEEAAVLARFRTKGYVRDTSKGATRGN